MPAGAAACPSTAAKPSSAAAACAGTGARIAAAADTAFTVKLVASQVSLAPGGTTTLTATSNQDVSPTPFFIEIFDATAGTLAATCGSGTTCATNVTQSGSTVRNYVAYVADAGKTFPPAAPQATSSFITVSWLTVGLTASPTALQPGGTTTLTATATLDVGATPFFIDVFDATTGTLVAQCGFGTSCATSVTQTGSTVRDYIAYVADQGSTFPPPDVRAASGGVFVSWITISLSVSPTCLPAGDSATAVATASVDVGPTPFYIEIFDETSHTNVAICGSGTVCVGSATRGTPGQDFLIAYVSLFSTTLPPPDIRATADPVQVNWFRSTSVVPNVLGFSQSDAETSIENAGLVPSVSFQNSCADPGDVLNQNPLGGSVVPFGSTVHITVDSSPIAC